MIELYDIIESVNSLIKDDSLILHRSMKVHPKFKVYKIFCYDLYKVTTQKKELLWSFTQTVNAPSEELTEIWSKYDKLYLRELIKWITSNDFKTMINGIQ